MSIIRAPRPEGNFYILDKRISEDCRLSWAARGLLVYLLGKPDHWVVSVQALINETSGARIKSGRDAVWALLGELMTAGYCQRVQSRNDDGTMGGMNYMISESASFVQPHQDQPFTGDPFTGQPGTANPPLVSTDKKQGLKKKQELRESAGAPPADAQGDDLTTDPKPASAPPASPPPPEKQDASASSVIQCPDGVTQQTWADWLALRKQKRAPVTNTVVTMARREAAKAGMPLEDFLQVWCVRGSQGLQASWLQNEQAPARGGPAFDQGAPVETYAQRAARQRVEEISPMVARKAPGERSAFERAQDFMNGGDIIDVTENKKQIGVNHG